jgi:hypothetical protein
MRKRGAKGKEAQSYREGLKTFPVDRLRRQRTIPPIAITLFPFGFENLDLCRKT